MLWKLAEIVHEADLDDERFDAPEAPGLDVVLRGLSMICDDDQVLAADRPDVRRPVRVPPPRPLLAARPIRPSEETDDTTDPTGPTPGRPPTGPLTSSA